MRLSDLIIAACSKLFTENLFSWDPHGPIGALPEMKQILTSTSNLVGHDLKFFIEFYCLANDLNTCSEKHVLVKDAQ